MRVLTALIAVCLVAGCASQPVATQATASVATPAAAPAVAAPGASLASTASVAGATTSAGDVKKYPGYKAKQKDGVTVYCKKVAKIGSRFEDEYCGTAAEMEAIEARAADDRENFRRNTTLCGTGVCGDDQ